MNKIQPLKTDKSQSFIKIQDLHEKRITDFSADPGFVSAAKTAEEFNKITKKTESEA